MSDLVLLFGVVVLGLVMAWFFGAFDDDEPAPLFRIAFADGSARWEGPGVAAELGFDEVENLETLKHIPLALKNLGSAPLEPRWDKWELVDPDGRRRALLCDGFGDAHAERRPEAPARLAPGEEADVLLIPRDNLGSSRWRISLKRVLLFADWSREQRFRFRLNLDFGAGPVELKLEASRRDRS